MLLFLSLFFPGLVSGCIPTYNPDFGEELFTASPNEPVTTAPPTEESTTVTQSTTVTTTTTAPCLPEWAYNPATESCYFLGPNNAVNWAAAEAICVTFNGHLVSIADQAEFDFVSGYAKQVSPTFDWAFWIGGTDPTSMGQFSWTDGTPFIFTIWAYNPPANSGICLALNLPASTVIEKEGYLVGMPSYCDFESHFMCKAPRL